MPEWLKEQIANLSSRKACIGSNPILSAKKINKKTRNCENYFVSLFCRVEEVNPSFEILYGVYGVKVARKFVVLSVWVRVPVNTHFEMLN